MNTETSKMAGLKQKAVHELGVFFAISLYLAFFLCSVATYKMILLNDFRDWYFDIGVALFNALVLAKIILIGEYAHLGKKHEAKPLLLSAVYKAFVFGLLVFGFHVIEEAVKRLFHGKDVARAFQEMRIEDMLSRALVVFCTFIPFFAFRELARVLGEDKFRDLFFRPAPSVQGDFPPGRNA